MQDKIKIHHLRNNMCSLCNKYFKASKTYIISTEYDGLTEVEFKINHPTCSNLYLKQRRLHDELVNVEWHIYLRQHSQ